MREIPLDLNLNSLPGPKRGRYPVLWFRDEIVWAPGESRFALAYSITEASMGNDVGCVAWGEAPQSKPTRITVLRGVRAACWGTPWSQWFDDSTFVFRAHVPAGKTVKVPLVAFDVIRGFAILEGTNNLDSWRVSDLRLPSMFTTFSRWAFHSQVDRVV